MTFLKKLLAPPVFDDEAKTREANLLNFILWGLVIAPIPYVLYIFIKSPELTSRAIIQLIIGEAVNIFLLWLTRRGEVRAASTLEVVLLWSFFTISAFTGKNVNGEAYLLGYPVVIIVAGSLLGARGSLTTAILSLTSGAVMLMAQAQGWMTTTPTTTSASAWYASLALFPMLALLQYITGHELRNALARAQASEERYRLISEISSDYTFSTEFDPDGGVRLAWVAGAFEKISGFTFEEYIATGGWLAHLHPDDREKDAQDTEKIKANQQVVSEVRTIKKNGETCWVQVYAHPVWNETQNRVTGIIGAVQDITERKHSESALTWERDLLQIFMDNIPDHVYFKDAKSKFIRVNKAQAAFLELNSPQDAIGKTDLDFQPPNLARQFLDEEKQILESGQPIVDRVEFNPTKDGKPRWLTATKIPVKDSSGDWFGTIGISRDITEQKQTEAMLAYERDILQIFMDNIPDQVYFKDSESRFVRINQGQAYFLGIDDPQDAIGKTDLDFQSPELAREFLAEEKRIMETGQPVLSRIEFNPTKDGKPRWLSTSKVPAKNESGQTIGIIGISIDVTEQKLAGEVEEARRRMLETVLELGKRVTEVSDLKTSLKRIWQAVHDDLNFDRLGIFLYNPENNSVDGTFGTSRQGEMVDESDLHIHLDNETAETLTFIKILHEENGVYVTHNYADERKAQKGDIMYGVKDYAAVAIWAGGRPMGVICVDNLTTERSIAYEQLEALRLFAGYAGLAIENSRLNDAIQTELNEKKQAEEVEQLRRHMLEKVVHLGKQVAEVTDLQTTLKRIWNGVRHELDFDRLAVFFYNVERNSMDSMIGTDTHGNMQDTSGIWFSIDEWVTFKTVLDKPDGVYITHNYDIENKIPEGDEMYGVKDYVAVAAWVGNKPVAVISVDQLVTGRSITPYQLEALRLFAGYAGLAIENSRLNTAVQAELNEKKQAEEVELSRRTMLEKVVQLGKQVAEVSDLKTTLEKIWYALHEGLDFDRIGIFAYQAETNSINRMLGTDIHGNRDDSPGESVLASEWHSFQLALEKPDGFYFTHDFSHEASIPEGQEMYEVKDYATVAAWAGGRPVAIIAVDQLITQRPITEQQLDALRLFAGYAALAIENSRLKDAIQDELDEKKQAEENEQRRRQMLEKVLRLGKYVAEVSDLQVTLERIWHIVHEDLGFDRIGIFFHNPDQNSMDRVLGTDLQGNMDKSSGVSVLLSEWTIFKAVFEKPDGFYLSHNFGIDNNIPKNNEMYRVKDYAAVAVWADNKPIAAICVDNILSGRRMEDKELEALRLFAGYTGFAIENSRLKEAILEELAEQKYLEENEQRRRRVLEKVMQLGKQVAEVSDLRTTLRKIWYGVRDKLDFDRVGLFTYNPQENNMMGAYGTDRDGNIWDAWHVRFELDENSLFYKVLLQPDGFYFTEDYEKEFNIPPGHEMAGVKYAALVAVWVGNKPIALISVDQLVTGRPIMEEQVEALRLFAGYAGLAISNSHLNDTLEGELAQKKNFIDELEAKNAELERFTYTASHDLKSPLVTITGFLGYLEKDALEGNQERMKSSIARISSAAEKMQALLNDLLELSRVGRLMNPPENVPFDEIVHEAVDRVRGRLDEVNAVVEIQRDFPIIHCDRVRIVEVVQNLIENAVKYAKPDSNPYIEIGSNSIDEKGYPVFHVRDNGIGIDIQYHERIFGLFNKLDAQSEGTGIGLSLVKRIIEVHNGRIWVESEKGQGATFYFSLPTS